MTVPVLGLDGGASGCRAVLVADDGQPLATAEAGPASAALPTARLEANLAALVTRLAADLPGAGALRIVAGLAGAGRPEAASRARRALEAALAAAGLTAAEVLVLTDAHIALLAVDPQLQGPAAVLIAGTGSIALAGAGSRVARAGGWGPYLGDEGGGFWLGRRVLELTVRHADGRCPEGAGLSGAVLAALGLADTDALVEATPRLWSAPADLAALAPVVLRAAAAGDPAAAALVGEAGRSLAAILQAARHAAALPPDAPTGLAGGLWREAGGLLRAALTAALPGEVARTCRPLAVPPEVGAACHLLSPQARDRLVAAARAV